MVAWAMTECSFRNTDNKKTPSLKGTKDRPVQLQVVEDMIANCAQTYRPCTLIYDPFQSVQLSQRLGARNVTTRQFNFTSQSVSKIAVTLHSLIRDGLLAIPNDPELIRNSPR